MLFANKIVLVVEANEEVTVTLEDQRETIEGKHIDATGHYKKEQLRCNISGDEQVGEPRMSVEEDVISQATSLDIQIRQSRVIRNLTKM